MAQTKTQIGRMKVAHPDLGYDTGDGGVNLHADLNTMFKAFSDHAVGRYFNISINNAQTINLVHNFGMVLSLITVSVHESDGTWIQYGSTSNWTLAQVDANTISIKNNTGVDDTIIVYVFGLDLRGVIVPGLDFSKTDQIKSSKALKLTGGIFSYGFQEIYAAFLSYLSGYAKLVIFGDTTTDYDGSFEIQLGKSNGSGSRISRFFLDKDRTKTYGSWIHNERLMETRSRYLTFDERERALSTWRCSTGQLDVDYRCGISCVGSPITVFNAWVASSGTGNRSGYIARSGTPQLPIVGTYTSAADNSWESVCYAAELGLLIAVASSGASNRVMTLDKDGSSTTWVIRTSAADYSWKSVCWCPPLGIAVAVANAGGTTNKVMTSINGTAWTLRTCPDQAWESVCWSPELGLFVAVASSGTGNRVMYSSDGINWSSASSASDNNWKSVCWSPELGLFVAVASSGTGNRVMTSSNGLTWTTRSSANDNNWTSVAWSSAIGAFAACANSGTGNRIMTSYDGIEWTTRTSAADNSWNTIWWDNLVQAFVVAASSGTGNRIMQCTRIKNMPASFGT